jgi:hypothetical protein
MLERLEFPLQFLEELRTTNFLGAADWQVQSRQLTDLLTIAIRNKSNKDIKEWIDNINFNPEALGSAFFMVYQFAVDYLRENSSLRGIPKTKR